MVGDAASEQTRSPSRASGDATGAAELSAEHWAHLGGLIDELFDSEDLDQAKA